MAAGEDHLCTDELDDHRDVGGGRSVGPRNPYRWDGTKPRPIHGVLSRALTMLAPMEDKIAPCKECGHEMKRIPLDIAFAGNLMRSQAGYFYKCKNCDATGS
jgi:hypothetical protein